MIFTVVPDPIQEYSRKIELEKLANADHTNEPPKDVQKKKPISRTKQLGLSFPFFILYFGANYFNNAAFSYTSVSSAVILQNASGLSSLVLGRIFGVEDLSMFKIISVVLTFFGVLLLKIFEYEGKDTFKGNCFALLAAFLYGCYSTYLKKFVGEGPDQLVPGTTMFGLTGLFSFLLMWPGLLYLQFTNSMPSPTPSLFCALIINAIMGTVIANYAWTVAITLTSSIMVAVGLSLMSPVAVVVDYFIKEKEIMLYKIGSIGLILIGFVFVNLASLRPQWDRIIFKDKFNNK
jgi:solute carrier family 35, member F5